MNFSYQTTISALFLYLLHITPDIFISLKKELLGYFLPLKRIVKDLMLKIY